MIPRLAAICILVLAVALKIMSTFRNDGTQWPGANWLIGLEIVLISWSVFSVRKLVSDAALAGFFTTSFLFNVYLLATGIASCGCLGVFSVSPGRMALISAVTSVLLLVGVAKQVDQVSKSEALAQLAGSAVPLVMVSTFAILFITDRRLADQTSILIHANRSRSSASIEPAPVQTLRVCQW